MTRQISESDYQAILAVLTGMQACIRTERNPFRNTEFEDENGNVQIVDTIKMHEVHPQAVALLERLQAHKEST